MQLLWTPHEYPRLALHTRLRGVPDLTNFLRISSHGYYSVRVSFSPAY